MPERRPKRRGDSPRRTSAQRRHQKGAEKAARDTKTVGTEFFIIAALTAVGSITFWTADNPLESGVFFAIALSFTQFLDGACWAIAEEAGSEAPKYVAWVLDTVAVGSFFGVGLLSRKRLKWAFWTGVVLYSLDAALAGIIIVIAGAEAFMPLALHGVILFFILKRWRESGAFFDRAAAIEVFGDDLDDAPRRRTRSSEEFDDADDDIDDNEEDEDDEALSPRERIRRRRQDRR